MQIKTTVTPIERNRVNISIQVEEGDIAKIRSIEFTGNQLFSDRTLRSNMELSTPNWLSWYTKRDQYSRQKLGADLESLRSYYLNRGYLDFRIDSVNVSISPDKKDIYVTINVFEGERYTVSSVKLGGELLGLDEELQPADHGEARRCLQRRADQRHRQGRDRSDEHARLCLCVGQCRAGGQSRYP